MQYALLVLVLFVTVLVLGWKVVPWILRRCYRIYFEEKKVHLQDLMADLEVPAPPLPFNKIHKE